MNKNKVQGLVKYWSRVVLGAIKEAVGKAAGNVAMTTEGKIQKNLGKAQAGYGDLMESLKK